MMVHTALLIDFVLSEPCFERAKACREAEQKYFTLGAWCAVWYLSKGRLKRSSSSRIDHPAAQLQALCLFFRVRLVGQQRTASTETAINWELCQQLQKPKNLPDKQVAAALSVDPRMAFVSLSVAI